VLDEQAAVTGGQLLHKAASGADKWACFTIRLIQNGSRWAVVTKLAIGCLEKCTQAALTGDVPGTPDQLRQGLCPLSSQLLEVT
jgi:hypothetical protein